MVVRWHYAGMALVAAGMLAGCSALRGPGSAPTAARKDAKEMKARPLPTQLPPATTAAARTPPAPPDYAPALHIPGPAQGSDAKRIVVDIKPDENVQTLPLTVPASAVTQAAVTTANLPPLTPAVQEHPLRTLHRRAKLKQDSITCYEMRLRRREVVGSKSKPEEIIQARIRTEPFSVYMKWLGPEAKDREVVFVKGQHGGLIHTLTAKDDIFLVPAGTRFKIAPDNVMVASRSRYPISEAGVGALIERFGRLVEAIERGDARHGTAKALGAFKRIEFEDKVEGVRQIIPPGADPLFPKGGQRLWCFDIDHGLPVLIVSYDDQEREVEYYCHDRFQFPGHLSDDAFDPDKLWPR